MKQFLRPMLFLAVVAAILLLSDLQNRKGGTHQISKKRIAVFRLNSNQFNVDSERGLLLQIRASEMFKKSRIDIQRYCAEGDMPTANVIARNIVGEKFDIVVSISTPGLQVMANANKNGELIHVFCTVTDPYGAGVGITGSAANQHPPHLVGIGSFQPVEKTFRIARQMNPNLKKVGVAWCNSEACSEACVGKARIICKELGIELVETSVETVSQVYEAALAVCSKGVEALWIGGDNIVETAIEMYIAAASKYKIPVFTNNPISVCKGGMFSLGADYFEIGRLAGDMVISILNGLPTRQIEVKDIVPETLFINDSVRRLMNDKWIFPDELLARADSIIR